MHLLKNNQIDISEKDWETLNKELSKEEIKGLISKLISDNNLKMPLRKITEEEANEDYIKLKRTKEQDIITQSQWFSRYDYRYSKKDIIIKANNVGNKMSDLFMQETRWECDSINAPSPYRSWNIERFRLTLLNALWSLKVKKVNNTVLRSCIGLRKYIASQFRPSAAKALYNYFEAKNVLDFSSGWGDRLAGFIVSDAKTYTGIDPNKKLFENYYKIINKYNEDKEINLYNNCAEDVYIDDKFDFIFTSPPYFNIERYTQEENQSFKKYRKLENWLELFLFKVLGKFWENLEVGGHLAINISDVYSNHKVNNICDPMNDFISKLKGAEYGGCIGYEMKKRPNSGAIKNRKGVFCEPVWIWKKIF